MMFVDASAMIAILTREEDARALADTLGCAVRPITSPVAIFEAVLGLRRKRQSTVAEASKDIDDFIKLAGITMEEIGTAELSLALSAFERFGKGRGHPAQLNLGDCFAYAVAAAHKVPILFKGDDFAKTDLQSAWTAG